MRQSFSLPNRSHTVIALLLFLCSHFTVAGKLTAQEVAAVGPNIISTAAQEFGATATPDGKTLYYTFTDNGYTRMTLLTSNFNGTSWSTPEVLPFSGVWNDADPSLSPDGKRIYFISNRPIDGKSTGFLEIWYTEKHPSGWQEPKPVEALLQDEGFKTYPSIASDGTLYFAVNGQVYLSRLKDGKHQPKEATGIASSAVSIAPDQAFMILHHSEAGQRNSNLAISFRTDSHWSDPVALPEPINSNASESSPNITADGKTLYFTSTRVDRSQITWPREQKLTNFTQVKSELKNTWQNGLRNIYKIQLSDKILKRGAP